MSDEKALAPIVQKTVTFYEDEITAVLVEAPTGREVYVPIGQFCDLLGINRRAQMQRINEDAVLSQQVASVMIDSEGGLQPTYCLPLDYFNGWLFSVNANRVKDSVRERLVLYQEKCYRVLATAFREGELAVDPELDDLLENSDMASAQAYRVLRALTKLARNQVMLESRLAEQAGQLSEHETQLTHHDTRLDEIEALLADPDRFLNTAQASRISQSVKAVALEMGKKTGRNEFGGVYGELYRKFEVSSYKEIPARRFREAMDFLSEWYRTLTNESLPF